MKYVYIFVVVFLSMTTRSLCSKCEPLDDQLQKLCHNVGYNYTASFPTEKGIRYQQKVYSKIHESYHWLSNCSKLSSLMVCSRYVPKCLGDESVPVLPCKQVCQEFVSNCEEKLDEKNLKLSYAALCHLLPDYKGDQSQAKCLRPEGFQRSSDVVEKLPKCSSSVSNCQQHNISLVSESMDSGIVLSNQCSQGLKTITCYSQSTPCISDNAPYLPCRSFCEKVKKNCSLEIAKINMSFPQCSVLPDMDSRKDQKDNLCKMQHWPVPWPNQNKDILTCYCDTCGANKLCQTNGSCFIQSLFTSKGMTTQRTCLPPGKQRDFICHHSQDYPFAKCCREDGCNKNIEGLFTTPTTTTQPKTQPKHNEVPVITEEKGFWNKIEKPTTNASSVATFPTVSNVYNSSNPRALSSAYMTVTIGVLIAIIVQN